MIEGAGRQRFAVGAEGQALDKVGVPGEVVELHAAGGVPDGLGLSLAAGEALAVGAEGQAVDAAVAGDSIPWRIETEQFLAGSGVADANRLIVRGRGQAFAIGAEYLVAHRVGVAV